MQPQTRVSIPRRYAENATWACAAHVLYKFQFLVGTLKTAASGRRLNHELLFQFLVGTLKTCQDRLCQPYVDWFQFLVGTLKTKMPEASQTADGMFQFLVGTLKTTRARAIIYLIIFVSIPRRYAENLLSVAHSPFPLGVSIPRRYAENLPHPLAGNFIFEFQFLVGTLKTEASRQQVKPDGVVSIPRRYAENPAPGLSRSRDCGVSIPRRYAENPFFSHGYCLYPSRRLTALSEKYLKCTQQSGLGETSCRRSPRIFTLSLVDDIRS